MIKSSIALVIQQQRRQKGITQEELAEASKVSARTIQRIESGAVVPHPQTLKLIAGALQLEYSAFALPQPDGAVPMDKLSLLPLFHLLPLIGFALPLLNILMPLILWFMKREVDPRYDIHGRQSVNFQITITILAIIAIILLVVYFPLGFPMMIIVYTYAIILCILNTVRSSQNKTVSYPLSIPFLPIAKRLTANSAGC